MRDCMLAYLGLGSGSTLHDAVLLMAIYSGIFALGRFVFKDYRGD